MSTGEVEVPKKIGKVKVAMGLGGKWMVWNGKQGRDEFSITCRNRQQANELAEQVNALKNKGGMVESKL